MRRICWTSALAGAMTALLACHPAIAAEKIRVLIIDGQNNHNWAAMTPPMKATLEKTGRFTVDVATTPPQPKAPVKPKDEKDEAAQAKYKREMDKFNESKAAYPTLMAKFRPDLTKYEVVLSNYNGDPWGAAFNKALETALKEGKIGLVIIHAANNAFGGWAEWNKMIGLGWRGKDFGDRVTVDDNGKVVRTPKGEGPDAGHGPQHEFKVIVRDSEHPVTQGMPKEWMHAKDELYHGQRGPAENMHILATAYSAPEQKGTSAHEPMIWWIPYGKGRVFTTVMGHAMGNDITAIRCIGFQTVMTRGCEWAATEKVTLPVPKDFPGTASPKLD